MVKMILTAVLLSAALPVAAQTPLCDGQLVTLRVSKLKPGGSLAGLNDAVRDNAAWYQAKGLTGDKFAAARIVESGKSGPQLSPTEVATLHVLGGQTPPEHKNDAGWAAFVAKYQANSTIVDEMRLCLPKGASLVMK